MYPSYLRKFMKNTPDRSAHVNSFNEVVHPLVAEVKQNRNNHNQRITGFINLCCLLASTRP